MPGVVADTHTILWYLSEDPRISAVAATALDAATESGEPIYVPSICVVETLYLVEKGRVPAATLDRLVAAFGELEAALVIAELDLAVALAMRRLPREAVPDMPDRIIAATALALDAPLVTCDRRLLAADVRTIW